MNISRESPQMQVLDYILGITKDCEATYVTSYRITLEKWHKPPLYYLRNALNTRINDINVSSQAIKYSPPLTPTTP